jgi:myo-inositol 2-dehydrogenase/D-chiro-inositol 1-dehydrogenase
MAQQIRYGIIGCGSMGREHIENIKMIDGCVVTAIADDHVVSRDAG